MITRTYRVKNGGVTPSKGSEKRARDPLNFRDYSKRVWNSYQPDPSHGQIKDTARGDERMFSFDVSGCELTIDNGVERVCAKASSREQIMEGLAQISFSGISLRRTSN